MEEPTPTSPPVKEVRVGSVSVTIWERDFQRNGRSETFLTASINKRYQDKSGAWKKSNSFTRRELADAAKAVQEALAFVEIYEHKERQAREAREEELE